MLHRIGAPRPRAAGPFVTLLCVALAALPSAAAPSADAPLPLPDLFRQTAPAVVVITQSDASGRPLALGSGFLVSSNGVLVTNAHVIEPQPGAAALTVKLASGATYTNVGVIHVDTGRDVAVLALSASGLPFLRVGNPDAVQVGETVVAIGNPEGLELTMTTGIVEGIRQDPATGARFIQHQAPLSHGSSGGPLLNLRGEVIGINAFVVADAQNLNGAVPITYAAPYFRDAPTMTWADYAQGPGAASAPTEPASAPAAPGGSSPQAPSLTFFMSADAFRTGEPPLQEGFSAGLFDTIAVFAAAVHDTGSVDPGGAVAFYECLARQGQQLGDVRAWIDSVAAAAPPARVPVMRALLAACGLSLPGSAVFVQDLTSYGGLGDLFRAGYAAGVFDGASLLAEQGRTDPQPLTGLFQCLVGRGNTLTAVTSWVGTVAAGADAHDPISDVVADACGP